MSLWKQQYLIKDLISDPLKDIGYKLVRVARDRAVELRFQIFIDRSPVKKSGLGRFVRFEVELKTSRLVAGKSNFVGSLLVIKDRLIGFLRNGVRHQIEISNIYSASPVLTDDLFKATQGYCLADAALEDK